MRALVTGGVRSGKSRIAESLLATGAERAVTYVAAGPSRDDQDWARRVEAHRARRPANWTTVETTDLCAALDAAAGPVLIDCLGTWLTARLDALDAWQAPAEQWEPVLRAEIDAFVDAWSRTTTAVAVSNEVGWGVVPPYRSGRIFADHLGLLNQRVADRSTLVILAVAGQALRVKDEVPRLGDRPGDYLEA